jgi:hypothetical protein
VDGGELATLDSIYHGLADDTEDAGRLVKSEPPVWGVFGDLGAQSALTRIRQGARGVGCSPVMKPSRAIAKRFAG